MTKREWASLKVYFEREMAARPAFKSLSLAALAQMEFLEKRREVRLANRRQRERKQRSV